MQPDTEQKTTTTTNKFQGPKNIPSDNSTVVSVMFTVRLLNMLEHKWVIAEFPQLHNGIHEGFRASFSLLSLFRTISQ
jgi:hypothetical protein